MNKFTWVGIAIGAGIFCCLGAIVQTHRGALQILNATDEVQIQVHKIGASQTFPFEEYWSGTSISYLLNADGTISLQGTTNKIGSASGNVTIDGTPIVSGASGITALTGDVTASGPGSASSSIASGAVTSAKIAANAVAQTNLQAGSVVSTNIAANSVAQTNLMAGSVVSTNIAANSVGQTNLQANAVVSTNIASGAVGSTQIASSVTLTTPNIGAATGTSVSLSGAATAQSLTGTNGVLSYATDAAAAVASGGWTNTFSKVASVYLSGTSLIFKVLNNAGTAVFTNVAPVSSATVLLQPSGKVLITGGTFSNGMAAPF